MKCIQNSITPLTKTQTNAVSYINKNKSLLVVHGTGLGKTLIAITASQCYLEQKSSNSVIVITSATLVQNFKNEFKKYGNIDTSKYTVITYEKFLMDDKNLNIHECKNKMLIIDEVHSLRNPFGVKFVSIMKCAQQSDKVLLLTATPVINSLKDLIPIINLLYGKYIIKTDNKYSTKYKNHPFFKLIIPNELPYSSKQFSQLTDYELREQLRTVKKLLKDKISYAKKPKSGDFPEVRIHDTKIKMSPSYQKDFLNALEKRKNITSILLDENNIDVIFKNPEVFYNGYRRAVNSLGSSYYSQKLDFCMKKITKNGKNLIFTNWLEFGVKVIKQELDKHNIRYAIISGDISLSKRNIAIKEFNNSTIDVLIITLAGSVGIDLKETRNIFVLDPVWNPALLDQIIGRGARYLSHSNLPKNQRYVDVYLLQLIENNIKDVKKSKSGDILLYEIIERKMRLVQEVEGLMKNLSI